MEEVSESPTIDPKKRIDELQIEIVKTVDRLNKLAQEKIKLEIKLLIENTMEGK